jgi:hypothetical protein
LGDVEAVPKDDVHGSLAMTLEIPAKKRLRSRKLLASVLARFKIGDGRVASKDFEHARIAAPQGRAVDGGGTERPSFGQLDLTVSLLAKENTGLLKLFADLRLVHPWEDSPEGGVRGDQVPRGAQPLSDLLLASEEIHLMEALAMKRQTPDQEHEERRHGNVGVFAELRKALGLLTEMELVVAETGKVCQTSRCPLLSVVRARAKKETYFRPSPDGWLTPRKLLKRRGFFQRVLARPAIRKKAAVLSFSHQTVTPAKPVPDFEVSA